MSDILQWARAQGLAQPVEGAGEGDFVDVVQGSFAGGLAGMLETGDVVRRGVESALGVPERDVLATGLARELRGVQARNQPAPEARGTFLGESFPSALGSVGSFALTGLAGGALGLGARGLAAVSGLSGFAQMAGPAYYEAKARGRDDMTAWTAFLAQGAVGSTEALGSVVPGLGRLGAWFASADRATKGSFSNALLGIVTSGAREGAQETGQGALEELVNAYVLQYPDAQRDLVEILKDRAVREGAPGAVIGVLFGGLEQAVYAGAQERAGTTLVGKSPEVQAEAQTLTTGAPVVSATPEETAALDRLRTDLGDASTVIVEDAPEYAPAVEFGRKRGHTVRTVRAPQGFEGYFDEDTGTIFVREGMRPTDAMDVVRGHEMAHALKSRNLGEWQELRDEIAGVDSAGLAEFEAAAAARYEQTTGRKIGDDLAQEEGVSYWTQNVLSPWLRQLERNPDRLAALAVDNRTFFRKLVEAGMDVLNSFGAKFKTLRAELAQLRTELGTAGARITLDQGRALAERYMRAMSGLAGEFQTRELEAGAPNYDAAQGADVQAQEVGGALAEGEYDMQVDQTLGAMGQTPPLLAAAPVQGVRDVFQPVSPTVQRQMQELESRDATRSKLVRNAKTGKMQFTPRLRPSEKLLGEEGTGGTMRDPRFAFALSDTLADTALGEHIEMRKAAYRDAYKGMFRKVVDYLDPVRDEMPNEYRSEMLRRSKTGQRIDNEMRPLRDAFVETMRKSGITLDEIGDFIQARGAGLRNYYAELINKDEGFNSGMKNEEAAPIIAAAKASGKYDTYVDLARQYDAINKRVRDIWRESGDRTAKYVDEIEQKYSHEAALEAGVADPDIAWDSYYSAYRTATDEESLDGVGSQSSFTAGGQGLGVSGSPVFAAFGRRSRADNPVPFAFIDLQSAIIRAGKLEVAREIAAHVEKRNDPQFARVVSMPMRRALNPETGLVEDMPDPAWKGRPDTLAFKTEDGKVRAIIFSRKYAHLAPILKGHTLTQPVIRKVAEWTRIFAGLLTRQNPAFFAVNYWRDLAQVVLAAHAKQGPDFARQVVLKQRRAIGEIYRAEFGGTRSAQMQEYLDSGARMGAYGFQDYADTAKSIEATLRGGRLREAGANFLRLIERFNDIAENATRYAVYQTAREKGMSIDEAAMLAKQEIGVNFERKGEYGPALSSLYAFAGAGIQGNANALSAMATKRGAAAVATIAALGFALDQMNRAVSGEDDDGELVYDNRPEWQKNASLIIELGGESALQLPMPHGWRWFFNLGRRTAAWATAGLYGASDFADLAFYEALDTVNPLGAGPVAQIASPTLLDPVVQLGSNETWTGKKIAPENLPFGAQKPDSDLYWRGTGELPIWMAQTLSEITDADDSGDGFLEVSPNTIEHFARVAFGGLGSTAVNIAENVGSLASGEVPTPKEAAIFNRFWAQNSPWAIDTRYSDARKEIESAEARYVELRKMGEGQRALEWRRANITLFKAIGALKATERSLSNLPNTPANEDRRRSVKARFNRKLHEIKSSQA